VEKFPLGLGKGPKKVLGLVKNVVKVKLTSGKIAMLQQGLLLQYARVAERKRLDNYF